MELPFQGGGGRCLLAALTGTCLAACYGNSKTTRVTTPEATPPTSYILGERPFEPVPLKLRALLSWQYRNAISDLLGADAAAVVTPPPDTTVNGWDAIGSAQLSLSPTAIDLYESSAQRAAAAAMNDPTVRGRLVSCPTGCSSDADCMNFFVGQFGRRAWRRPLSADEQAAWSSVGADAAAAYGDFFKGIEFIIAGLLQSPNFLYQVEIGEVDPLNPDRRKLSGFELATRLSFFLTGSTPNEDLLEAAERGDLDSPEGIRDWARRLLGEASARDAVSHFFDELLQLRDLPQLSKDPIVFPAFSTALASAMRVETQQLLASLIWDEDADFRRFFDADYTFVNRDLAALYDLPEVSSTDFVRMSLPEGRRAGFFGQASFLSLMAHPATTSPTLRGKFIREKLLCQDIPPPPPNVDISLPPTEGVTARQRLLAHRQNPACASCHGMMDDIGLGLENFDAIGRYRELDSGQPIDALSRLDDLGSFAGARELGTLLRGEPRVTLCLTRNLLRAATGHIDTLGESGAINETHNRFADSGFRLKEALIELAGTDAFRFGAMDPGSGP